MKSKIDEVRKAYRDKQKAHAERSKKIAELEERKATLDNAARNEAINDNLESFKTIKQEAEYVGYQLEALKAKQKSEEKITLPIDELKAAWKATEEARAKETARLEADINKATEALYKAFKELTESQNNALMMRNECAEMAGLDPAKSSFSDLDKVRKLNSVFPIKLYEAKTVEKARGRVPIEILYLMNCGKIADSENVNILRLHDVFCAAIPQPEINL